MKQQLRRMQEAINLIRSASDEELHEILISIGARSTKPNAVSERIKIHVSRAIVDDVLPHGKCNTFGFTEHEGGRIQTQTLTVARYGCGAASSTFHNIVVSGELVA